MHRSNEKKWTSKEVVLRASLDEPLTTRKFCSRPECAGKNWPSLPSEWILRRRDEGNRRNWTTSHHLSMKGSEILYHKNAHDEKGGRRDRSKVSPLSMRKLDQLLIDIIYTLIRHVVQLSNDSGENPKLTIG